MNITRIRYFLTLCETLHFTNTAKSLGISQPALTKSISHLEAELGTRLIQREGKHTHLTHAGIAVRQEFKDLINLVDKIEENIARSISPQQKSIKLSIQHSLNIELFTPFLKHFLDSFPNVHIEISDCYDSECEESVLKGEVDIGLCVDSEFIDNRILKVALFEDSVGVLSSADKPSDVDKLAKLLDQHSILSSSEAGHNVYSHKHDKLQAIIGCKNEHWTRDLVSAGIGSAIVSSTESKAKASSATCWHALGYRKIVALIPTGRHENEPKSNFIELIKSYHWPGHRNWRQTASQSQG